MGPEYEVLAVRYGTRSTTRADCFYGYRATTDDEPALVVDYFFWVIRNDEETILVDTGFDPEAARRRGRTCVIAPLDALEHLGIERRAVTQVIVSHFHYDHIGNTAAFADATITLQRRELDFWLGPHAARGRFSELIEPAEIEHLATCARAGRVHAVDGSAEVAPGITVRLVGGHCPGQQITIVDTATSTVVLASDALHLYEEIARDMPFATFSNLQESYQCFDTLNELQRGGAVLVPGHDPTVMERFATVDRPFGDLAVKIA